MKGNGRSAHHLIIHHKIDETGRLRGLVDLFLFKGGGEDDFSAYLLPLLQGVFKGVHIGKLTILSIQFFMV